MLKTIAQPAPEVASFIEGLNLPLPRRQQRHVTQIADSLVTKEGTVYVILRLRVGNVSLTVDMALYLRAKTVRRHRPSSGAELKIGMSFAR